MKAGERWRYAFRNVHTFLLASSTSQCRLKMSSLGDDYRRYKADEVDQTWGHNEPIYA